MDIDNLLAIVEADIDDVSEWSVYNDDRLNEEVSLLRSIMTLAKDKIRESKIEKFYIENDVPAIDPN